MKLYRALKTPPSFLSVSTWITEKDAPYFSEGCSVCISSCVFTGGHYDKIKEGYFHKLSCDQSTK